MTQSTRTIPGSAADRLRARTPAILARWEERIRREVPAARDKDSEALRNSIPRFLEHLTDQLSGKERSEHGFVDVCREHALHRADLAGYSVDMVLLEYALLRKTILEALQMDGPLASEERDAILDSVNDGMREAAKEFVAVQQRVSRDNEEKYRLLVENARDYGMFLMGADGRITSWNPGAERVLGWTEEEMCGQTCARIFTPEDLAAGERDREMTKARTEGRAEDERWHMRKDGSRFFASGVMTAVYDAEGNPSGYAKILRDVTPRKQIEDALARENRAKDEFLGMLAHELRNPLGAISNGVHLVGMREDLQPTAKRTLKMLQRQVQTMTQIVDDLLDVSRITHGKITLQRRPISLNDLVLHAVESVRPLVDSRSQGMEVGVPEEQIDLLADPVRLEQVLTNLINNAAKYTDPGGRISITAEHVVNEVVIRVRDTGIGITADMLPRIFDLFAQSERGLDRAQGGLGIGLTLVRRLVEMHGGRVEAYSAGLGQGSEFVVYLPLVPPPPDERRKKPSLPVAPDRRKKRVTRDGVPRPARVLVVEDDLDEARTLTEILEVWGHHVLSVHDGPTALEAATAYNPDMMLIDIGLPGLDGYEIARLVRIQKTLDHTLLVAATGYGREGDRAVAEEAGFDEHLTKPIDLHVLQGLLTRFTKGDGYDS